MDGGRFIRKQEMRKRYGDDEKTLLFQKDWLESLNRNYRADFSGVCDSTIEEYELICEIMREKGFLPAKPKRRRPQEGTSERVCPSCEGRGELNPLDWFRYECIACSGFGVTQKTDVQIKTDWTQYWIWLPEQRAAKQGYMLPDIKMFTSHIEYIDKWGKSKYRDSK